MKPRNFVGWFLFAFVIGLITGGITAAHAAEIPPAHQLPTEAPLSVVWVEQCGSVIQFVAIMRDGTQWVMDERSPIPLDEMNAWGLTAKYSSTAHARCIIANKPPVET